MKVGNNVKNEVSKLSESGLSGFKDLQEGNLGADTIFQRLMNWEITVGKNA